MQRNDRAALESRDDKHCHAAPARSCRRGSFTRRARRQRPVPCRWRRKPSGRQGAAGTRGGAFTRWRIGGGARRDRGDRAAKAIAISERRARRPAARATAREAADGSQMPSMPFRLQGGVEGVRRRPAQRASQTARLCVDIGTTGRMGCVEIWALVPLVGLHIGAMLASDACWLGRKLGALGTLAPLVSSNGNLSPMLKAALGEDLCRVGFPDPPAWFVEEERDLNERRR